MTHLRASRTAQSPSAVTISTPASGAARNLPANFVCLSITDEDPTRTDEEKTACWYWTNPGGYYWAGAYACEDYVLVGTDDGADESTSMTGSLLLLDAKTGQTA